MHELGVGRYVLGRTREADLRLEHEDVSRRQAELIVRDQGAELIDLGSKNGTLVDGQRIDRVQLQDGAQLQFGDLVLELDHPGARVDQILTRSGEPTVSRSNVVVGRPHLIEARPVSRSVLPPLLMALVFAIALVLLLVLG